MQESVVSADNCESLQELKKSFGERVSISGNLTPVEVLKDGTQEEIEANVKKCIWEAGDNPKILDLMPLDALKQLCPTLDYYNGESSL